MSPSPAASSYALGTFAEFPAGPLPEGAEAAVQAVVDTAAEAGAFEGVSASVISAGRAAGPGWPVPGTACQ